jgi:trimethylamine--corrinoid protein Co-methyltransferase
MAGLAGTNMIYEAAGMHASLMGFCMESLIIDNDILGQSLRCVRGIDVSPDAMSIQTMRDVCLGGPEHYLGHAQTLSLMQTEYIYPTVGDRLSPKEWEAEGKEIMIDRAIKEKRRILDEYFPSHISPEMDAELRRKFDIKLPRERMLRTH